MKNKICYIFLGLLLCFTFITSVYADDELKFTVNASADSTNVTKGDEVTISVALSSDSAIANCLFSVSADDTLEYIEAKGANSWNVTSTGVNGILVENGLDNNSAISNKTILQLKYTVNGSGKVSVTTKECVSTIEETKNSYSPISIDITAVDPADDTSLSSITVTHGGQMLTTFDPDVLEGYLIKLSSSNFGLSITASNSDYQDDIVVTDINDNVISDYSNITFSDPSGQGMMPIKITVNGKTTYDLVARYNEGLDNSLKSLTVNGKSVTLESGKVDYRITVESSVTSVEISAVLADSENFKFGNSFSGTTKLTLSSNTTSYAIVIEPVSSELGAESKTYYIEIVKEGTTSSGSSSSSSQSGNTTSNPQTGGVSMAVMVIILFASLIGSIYLYQKNIEGIK